MKPAMKTLLFSCALVLSLLVSSSTAQTCSSQTFTNNAIFSNCNDLPVLNSYLHWTYNQSTHIAEIAYRHTGVTTSDWVAWAINPTGTGMVGSQALIAYQNSSSVMHAYTSPISQYQTSLPEGDLSFGVSNLAAVYASGEITIFATLQLSSSLTTVNQVWQDGPLSSGSPNIHSTTGDSLNSKGTVNFLSGQTTSSGSGTSKQRRRNVHGVLNAVSWGTLMPMGAMIARYMRVFKSADPAWFYLHVACQSSAYIVGVAGWATGIKLGNDSPGVQHDTHRNIGITLFALGTLQVFALLLRPKKDHKLRLYWNIYHHSIGYTVIILSIINIFEGLDILEPEKKWKRIYTGIIIFLGACTAILEAITWFIVIKRKKGNSQKFPSAANGAGYGTRPDHA